MFAGAKIVIPRPSKKLETDWGAPLPADEYWHDVLGDFVAALYSAVFEDERRCEATGRAEIAALASRVMALAEAGPEGVKYPAARRKRVRG